MVVFFTEKLCCLCDRSNARIVVSILWTLAINVIVARSPTDCFFAGGDRQWMGRREKKERNKRSLQLLIENSCEGFV